MNDMYQKILDFGEKNTIQMKNFDYCSNFKFTVSFIVKLRKITKCTIVDLSSVKSNKQPTCPYKYRFMRFKCN